MGNSPSKNDLLSTTTARARGAPLGDASEGDTDEPAPALSRPTGNGRTHEYPAHSAPRSIAVPRNRSRSDLDVEIDVAMATLLQNSLPASAPSNYLADSVPLSVSPVFTTLDHKDASLVLLASPAGGSPPDFAGLEPIKERFLSLSSSETSPVLAARKLPVDVDAVVERLLAVKGKGRKNRDKLPVTPQEIKYILAKARAVFLEQPTLLKLSPPVKVVGDIHGQYHDLLRIFNLCGYPPYTNYLFLGDYVDRGHKLLETILLLLCYKIKYPENFFMLRGNHESANITKIYGFYDECKRRLPLIAGSHKMWKNFVDVFNTLPFAATINDKIFCIHGGLSPDLKDLRQIEQLHRPTDIPDKGLLADLLWSDPDPQVRTFSLSNWPKNDRGVLYCFGKKHVDYFLASFGMDLIVRGHMVVEDGYEFFNKRKLVTVFSAPNYCGEFNNYGAVMSVDKSLCCSFELLKPQ